MTTIKEFVKKSFLSNDPYETGSVSVWVIVSKYEHDRVFNGKHDVSAEVVIKDCNKTISLDFYADDPVSQQKRLSKLDTLISVLQEFRQALPEMYDEYNKLEKLNNSVDKREQEG